MSKNRIFSQRKELKKKSRAVVRSHFFVLVIMTLILSVFGTEYHVSISGWGKARSSENGTSSDEDDPGSILAVDDVSSTAEILQDIMNGRLKEGAEKSEEISDKIRTENDDTGAFGRSRGVFAQLVNTFFSGRLFVYLGQAVRVIFRSDLAVGVIFTVVSFLGYMLVFFLLKNVLSAVVRRMFLQARIYKYVAFPDALHFAAVKKWINACRVMFVKTVLLSLWNLTVIGGIIKYYSYWAVPYIVAENPSVYVKEAITLSEKMMNGHKIELFKYQLTLLGWTLLGIVTFGISDLVYGNAYRIACYTEFYAMLREEAVRSGMEGTGVLNDPYLFRKADRILLYETYFEVVDEITLLHENRIRLTGLRKLAADWLGVWLGSLRSKTAYDEQEGREYILTRNKQCMSGEAYPQWLNPLWIKDRKLEKRGHFFFIRNYTIWTLFLLFIIFCFVGWFWEVALHLLQTGELVNRGTLHGPWLPIYGTGGLIALLLCSRLRKNPVAEFIMAVVLCGILEYTSGWYLEQKYGVRWWSYDGYFLNLHGRICAEGLLVFGTGCCAVIYLAAPMFDYLLSMVKEKILIGICIVLFLFYIVDLTYSRKHPNMAKGAVEEDMEMISGTDTGGL